MFVWTTTLLPLFAFLVAHTQAFFFPSSGGGGCGCQAAPACAPPPPPPQPVCPPPQPAPCSPCRQRKRALAHGVRTQQLSMQPLQSVAALDELDRTQIGGLPLQPMNAAPNVDDAPMVQPAGVIEEAPKALVPAEQHDAPPLSAGVADSLHRGRDELRELQPDDSDLFVGRRTAGHVRWAPEKIEASTSTAAPPESFEESTTPAAPPSTTELALGPNCNSNVLKRLMVENMTDNSSDSKRAINRAAEEKFGGETTVICSRGHFSYVYSSNLYCEATKGRLTCIAFRQAVAAAAAAAAAV